MENKAKYSVLLVDDEPEILDKFTNYIQEQDLNVYKFTNPNQAIRCLIENQYEIVCIISDFALPDMTGLEFRQKIIQDYSHIPFIICSLPISPDDKLHALELKISSFIQKPVSKEELIKNILEQSKNRITQLNDDRELKLGFVAEAENLLEELEGLLLDLENNQDQESLNRIFAIIHTIKGSSCFFQEDIINKFTHKYEDFFSPYNKKLKPLSHNIIDILLKGADVIKNLVQALKNNTIYHHNLDNYLPLLNDLKLAQTQEQSKLSTENTQQNNNLAKAKEDIKVGLNLLDEFSELSGEITVIRNMINKAVKNIEKEFTGNKNVSTLCELLSEMHKINSTLQEKVVDIRKAPLKNIFKPLQRTVRDLAITLKKSVNLKIIADNRIISDGENILLSATIFWFFRFPCKSLPIKTSF